MIKKGKEKGGGNGNIMDRMNFFKEHCPHYHNEIPHLTNVC
jgi:hypothetical protein